MRALIACEVSGKVRAAMRAHGVDAWSCDILDADDGSEFHIKGDVIDIYRNIWDMVIAFPPCTHLAVSGARWFKEKRADGRQQKAIDFFMWFTRLDAPMVAIENPVGIMSAKYRKPDQIIQPWQYGHRVSKATCLWLNGLPKLQPVDIVGPPKTREEKKEFATIHRMAPSYDRAKKRSETFDGIALAMAGQWGCL